MTKRQLINVVARKAHLTKKGADEAIEVFLDEIGRTLAKGEKVTIHGFGTFRSKRMQGKTVRIPNTDKFVTIKPYRLPRFTAGQALKRIVNR